MARTTLSSAVEIGFPCFGIARNDVQNLICSAQSGCPNAIVKKCGNVGDLVFTESEFRHAFIGSAVENDRADFIAVFVVENHHGAKEVRTSFPAFRIGAVAKGAGRDKHFLAAFHGFRIVGGITSSGSATPPTGSRPARGPACIPGGTFRRRRSGCLRNSRLRC